MKCDRNSLDRNSKELPPLERAYCAILSGNYNLFLIPSLNDSPPKTEEEKTQTKFNNLFDSVLKNSALNKSQQCETLCQLLDEDNHIYFAKFLMIPEKFAKIFSDEFYPAIKENYLSLLKNGNTTIVESIKHEIWRKFLEKEEDSLLFANILQCSPTKPILLFEFIKFYLTVHKDINETIAAFELMENIIKQMKIYQFTSDILKIFKLKILDLIFNQLNNVNQQNIKEFQEAVNLSAKGKELLNFHRFPFWLGGFGMTRSFSIYDLIIQGNIMLARKKYEEDVNNLIDELNKKYNDNSPDIVNKNWHFSLRK